MPTPQERLRHAFSADIPEDILERPARRASRVATRTRARPYATPPPWGHARSVGQPVIRVVGVGGAGVNAVNRMVEAEVEGVEFLAINTDLQSLQQSDRRRHAAHRRRASRAASAPGPTPTSAAQAAMEDYDRIKALLKGSDMVFIAAGAGGGTGTGAAPVVARIARELGALTVGIVTKPFGFEGSRRRERRRRRHRGAGRRGRHADRRAEQPAAVACSTSRPSMVEAFRVADDVLRQGVQGISRPRHAARASSTSTSPTCARSCPRPATRCSASAWARARSARSRPPSRPSSSPLLETSHGGRALDPAVDHRRRATCRCGRSTRRPRPCRRPPTPTRTSSSARWSTRSSTTRCG